MKRLLKSFLSASLLFASVLGACNSSGGSCTTNTNCCDDDCCTDLHSIIMARSQGDNLVLNNTYRHYIFTEDEDECFRAVFDASYRFQRNFREERLARTLFGCNCLNFKGSNVSTRNDRDLLADNFGLHPDTNASVCFEPRIDNHILNLELYIDLYDWCEGLWFQIDAPITYSKWTLCECNADCCDDNCNGCDGGSCSTTRSSKVSSESFPAGYMDTLDQDVKSAGNLWTALGGDFTFGDMSQRWNYGRFASCDCDDAQLADLTLKLGYDFVECEDYHFGAYLRLSAPTGTDIDDCYARNIFNVKIGDDHWKLGAGICAHAELYNCDDNLINVYFEGYLTHWFERCQTRSFDFTNNGLMSRYLLLKEFDSNNAYTGNLINAINYTTQNADVKVGVQGEGIIEFVYENDCGLCVGLGYNIYGKSEEDVCICGPACNAVKGKNYGIKGCLPIEVQGYATDGADPNQLINGGPGTKYVVNSTASNATAYKCGDQDNSQVLWNKANPGYVYVCYKNTASTADNAPVTPIMKAYESDKTAVTINAANGAVTATPDPVYVGSLNTCSGIADSQITHKIFGHIGWEWTDCDWEPSLRVGGEVEFASCSDSGAVNAWGAFISGNVTF